MQATWLDDNSRHRLSKENPTLSYIPGLDEDRFEYDPSLKLGKQMSSRSLFDDVFVTVVVAALDHSCLKECI